MNAAYGRGPVDRTVGRRALTVHQRIMRAARRGTGIRLSAEDVGKLAADDAIATCAENDDEEMGLPKQSRF